MIPSKNNNEQVTGPIGIFDSGYGGLTVLREIMAKLPHYDFIYLGDNARNPYGPRSYEVVYRYTLQAVEHLFERGAPLVIIACNTASAKALRTIQQNDLCRIDSSRRVLGVIRPTVEEIGRLTKTRHVGILATQGTVASESYLIELSKLFPDITVVQEACPIWVPLVEYNEYNTDGADYFVRRHVDALLARDNMIDLVVLGCTHYPLLLPKIRAAIPQHINIFEQGPVVAGSLSEYLVRHPEIDSRITRNGSCSYLTTESPGIFDRQGLQFMKYQLHAEHVDLSDHL
jgi:glutamate racemase